jgi:hypothetical protein
MLKVQKAEHERGPSGRLGGFESPLSATQSAIFAFSAEDSKILDIFARFVCL